MGQDLPLPAGGGVHQEDLRDVHQEDASQDFHHAVSSAPHLGLPRLCHRPPQLSVAAAQSTPGESVAELVAPSSWQPAAEVQTEPHGQSLGNIFKPVSEAVELWDRNTKLAAELKARILGAKDEARKQ